MILNRKKASFPRLGWVRWFPQRGATQRRLAMEGPDPGACPPSPIRPPEKERPGHFIPPGQALFWPGCPLPCSR